MSIPSAASLIEQLAIADLLRHGAGIMLDPQDLPGRYGRVVRAIDRILAVVGCQAVVGGGWAVWRHGFVGRVTQDIDIVLSRDSLAEFLRVASVAGFDVLVDEPGRWPKLRHRESDVQIDVLPEGERPGVPPALAPTTIPSPTELGAAGSSLSYVTLPRLVELKLAAGRLKDLADVLELLRANESQIGELRDHLRTIHPRYVEEFDRLVARANSEGADR